ncbi:MAG: histidine kinase [Sphingobacteriales bacterium]|nr:MAG: histidine kinase [Sphingobacteriales bacterium]
MTRKQLWFAYAIVCFFTIWGWDLINSLKFKGAVTMHQVINPFHASQLIYTLATFWFTRIIFKKFYPAKKYVLLILSLLGLMIVFSLIRYTLEEALYPLLFNIRNYPKNVNIIYYVLDNLYYALVYITFGTLIFLFDQQLTTQKNEAALKQESIQAQLAFLRSQVSPHFLFNSLNNIYSLSYKKSDKAPDAILKLSELTRYMLYEKQEQIPLEKEWNYIQNFISLQQLRYDFPLNIQVTATGNINSAFIAPYLLIPFVENAFKHGDVQDKENPLSIELNCDSRQISFRVKNKIGLQQKDKDGGIGLENVRKRLQLLYSANHELLINKQNDIFESHLKIKLHAN